MMIFQKSLKSMQTSITAGLKEGFTDLKECLKTKEEKIDKEKNNI